MLLSIRPEQLTLLQRQLDARYVAEIAATIRAEFATLVDHLADAELSAAVAAGLETARRYEFLDRLSVSKYVVLATLAGPPFAASAEIDALLKEGGGTADEKLDALMAEFAGELQRRAGAARAG